MGHDINLNEMQRRISRTMSCRCQYRIWRCVCVGARELKTLCPALTSQPDMKQLGRVEANWKTLHRQAEQSVPHVTPNFIHNVELF